MQNKLNSISQWLILSYIFLLPWQTVYIFDEKFINGAKSQFLTGQLYATELFLILIIILYLIFSRRDMQFTVFKKILNLSFFSDFKSLGHKKIFVIFLWLFLAYAGLSVLWSANQSSAYYLWLHLGEAGALLLLILAVGISRIKLLWTITLTSGLQGCLALQQFLTQAIPADKWLGIAYHSASRLGDIVIETADGRWLRAYGSFSHPNILGGFLLLGLISAAILWRYYFHSVDRKLITTDSIRLAINDPMVKKFIYHWLKLLALLSLSLIISAGLFVSFSRSAWLGLILAWLIFFWPLQRAVRQKIPLLELVQFWLFPLSSLLLVLLLAIIFNPLVFSRANFTNRLEIISQTERLDQTKDAWSIIKHSPLLGVGLNNYTKQLSETYPDRPAYQLQPVHNIYLLLTAELGLIGLALATSFMVALVALAVKAKDRAGIIAIFGSFALIGSFDHYLYTQYAGLMIIAISVAFVLAENSAD